MKKLITITGNPQTGKHSLAQSLTQHGSLVNANRLAMMTNFPVTLQLSAKRHSHPHLKLVNQHSVFSAPMDYIGTL